MKTLGHGDCDGQAAGIQKPGAHTQMGRHPRMFTLTATHTPPPCSRPPSQPPAPPFPTAFVPRRYIQKRVGDTIPYDPL